jgi:hypothetical protein
VVSEEPAHVGPRTARPSERDDAGHYAYYGMSGNYRRLSWYAMAVARIWRKWLSRRDRQRSMSWSRFAELLRRHPLPAARIVHCYTGTLL